ncbi:MAG TPA: hypothetical protein VIM34_13995 [Burkholderiaceae bacterium]
MGEDVQTEQKPWQASEEYWNALKTACQMRAWRLVALSLNIKPTKGIRARLAGEPALLAEYQHRLRVTSYLMSAKAIRGHLRYVPDADNDGVKSDPKAGRTERMVNLFEFVYFCEDHEFAVEQRMKGIAAELRRGKLWGAQASLIDEERMLKNALGGVTRRHRTLSRLVVGLLARGKDVSLTEVVDGKPFDATTVTAPSVLADQLTTAGVECGEPRAVKNAIEDSIHTIGGRVVVSAKVLSSNS